jgi:hypothetical protein
LYEKLAGPLLGFDRSFREAEERATRSGRRADHLLPSDESAFMESVTETSITLTSSLQQEAAEETSAVAARVPASILEKLAPKDERDEELSDSL